MKAYEAAPNVVNFCRIDHKIIGPDGMERYFTGCDATVRADADKAEEAR